MWPRGRRVTTASAQQGRRLLRTHHWKVEEKWSFLDGNNFKPRILTHPNFQSRLGMEAIFRRAET